MNFKVREKVVCIDDSDTKDSIYLKDLGVIFPKKGEIYTIRSIENNINGIGFLLDEIRNGLIEYLDGVSEQTFKSSRFRKLNYEFAENLLAKIKEEVMSNNN